LLIYEHGGQIEQFVKELDCDICEVIDLSSNINFVKPKIDIDFNTLDISAYPTYDNLYKAIGENYNINTTQLELFNGGSSAIFTLFRHLKLKHCTIYSPAYLEYKKAANIFGYELDIINRFENITQEPKENSLVIFVNPSTPDGMLYNIEKFMDIWREKNCTVLIDESFLDFTNGISAVKYLDYDRLYILKSMTKFYSSAGIRVGCIVSNEQNILNLQESEPAWKISQFDSQYLQEALKDEQFKAISKNKNDINRSKLKQVLENSKYFKKIFTTYSNYFLVQLESLTAKQFQDMLKPHKIMVRDCSNFDCLDNSYIRIAVKDEASIELLQKVLSGFTDE